MTAKKKPPPSSNTGVEKRVYQKIDWLEVTFKRGAQVQLPEILTREYKECPPFNGYTVACKYSDGRIELANPNRPDMGTHIVWSAGSLGCLPISPLELVRFLHHTGATFTRIDLAVDAVNYGLTAKEATDYVTAGKYSSRAKKCPAWFDAAGAGWTQYIGTKASEIYMRIYDKAAEMGISGDHTRIELVVKSGRANKAVEAILSGSNYSQLVLGFVRFQGWKEWNEVMADYAVTLPAEKKDSNTKIWLLKQCAPALASVLDDDSDDEFWFRFLDIVKSSRKMQ